MVCIDERYRDCENNFSGWMRNCINEGFIESKAYYKDVERFFLDMEKIFKGDITMKKDFLNKKRKKEEENKNCAVVKNNNNNNNNNSDDDDDDNGPEGLIIK